MSILVVLLFGRRKNKTSNMDESERQQKQRDNLGDYFAKYTDI